MLPLPEIFVSFSFYSKCVKVQHSLWNILIYRESYCKIRLLNTVNFQVFWEILFHSNFTRMHGFKSGSELCSFLKGGTSRRVIMYVWIYITLPGDLLNVSLKN